MKRSNSIFDRIWLIPALSLAAYFTFSSNSALIFGGLIGWAVCAVWTRVDRLQRVFVGQELLRQFQEYPDEAESGKTITEIEMRIEKATTRRWQSL